ncbi:MAG: hypothetical protein KAS72_07730 [Phycisphaerales bacterium]|nr:hypothetical protein [Phycisphaerales bacterium]
MTVVVAVVCACVLFGGWLRGDASRIAFSSRGRLLFRISVAGSTTTLALIVLVAVTGSPNGGTGRAIVAYAVLGLFLISVIAAIVLVLRAVLRVSGRCCEHRLDKAVRRVGAYGMAFAAGLAIAVVWGWIGRDNVQDSVFGISRPAAILHGTLGILAPIVIFLWVRLMFDLAADLRPRSASLRNEARREWRETEKG